MFMSKECVEFIIIWTMAANNVKLKKKKKLMRQFQRERVSTS